MPEGGKMRFTTYFMMATQVLCHFGSHIHIHITSIALTGGSAQTMGMEKQQHPGLRSAFSGRAKSGLC